ncbi:MAG: hypothetical protein IKH04_13130 [Kiritimatiellae bacterium]|nr:hypothetical protein [Kiritimatiellia bacterium]
MKTPRFIASGLAFACALAVPSTGSARTVYDAGKALRANCTAETGAYANPYTDENGGVWGYYIGNLALTTTSTLNSGTYSWSGNPLAGFAVDNGKQATSVRVYNSDTAKELSNGETLQPSELILFPGNSDNQNACVRFTAPSAGWYSAFVSAHDLAKENSASVNSGTMVTVMAQGNTLVQQIVSCEKYADASSTLRFDFQMPVRYLAAGDAITVFVGRNGANSSDNTGVTFIVTKEDEGAFYDSGLAMTNNLATRYENPYGSIAEGTWYYLIATAPSKDAAPQNVSSAAGSRFKESGANSSQNGFFIEDRIGSAPYFVANETASLQANIAPCELRVHTHAGDNSYTKWPVLRFRPPVSGFYSASIVARDVARGTAATANGVDVYLFVADTLVTNAYVSLESFASTAHLTFDSRLMAAGEPIDIVISPSGDYYSDATGISAIFRRDGDSICDAGISYYKEHESRRCSNYFSDQSDNAAKWLLAMKSDPWLEAHSPLGTYLTPAGTTLDWWTHATGTSNNGTAPRFAMATNGIASVDSLYVSATAPLLSTTPFEIVAQPSATKSPSLRAEVPSDGVYRARGYARDLIVGTAANGVRALLSAGGYGPDSVIVSRDNGSAYPYEAAVAAGSLWMKSGEALYFTVDSMSDSASDSTAISACYVREGDIPASRVVNVDIGAAGEGKLSPFAGRGREGFSDWTAWNALRPGDSAAAAVENCREADGTTRRNVTVALERSSPGAAASGATGCAMLDTGVSSTGAADATAFTVSGLVPGAAYTLYLYGTGDAAFTVGGESKGLEGQWLRSDCEPCFARFDAAADASGKIAGSFAASTAEGAAFSGLSIVGEFPQYAPSAFTLVIR